MKVRVAWAQTPRLGERICGDDVLVLEGDSTVVAVVDGLGHGAAAAEAAVRFTAFVRRMAHLSPLPILEASSRELAGTRGAVAAVARFDRNKGEMLVAGVGNIEVRAVSRLPIAPVFTPGILGRPVRPIREFRFELSPGDLVVFASDGISRRFDVRAVAPLPLEEVPGRILREFGVTHDDATCVAVAMEHDADET